MLHSRSLRWSGAAVNARRQRVVATQRGSRLYSLTPSRSSSLAGSASRLRRQPSNHFSSPSQVRSISVWGWGTSASKEVDFAKAHSPKEGPGPDPGLGNDGQTLLQQTSTSSRSVSAVHQTSDLPPPSSFSSVPEPAPPDVTTIPLERIDPLPQAAPHTDALDPTEALSAIPERIGYLKEVCGIDFGWGTSALMEWMLEHIHIWGGTTWATSIVLLALGTRLLVFYPTMLGSDMAQRVKIAGSVMNPIKEKMQAAHRAQDRRGAAEAKAELLALNSAYKLKYWRVILPIVLQIPLQFGCFRTLRNMTELPVPALERENWLWAQDLTLSDPLWILPTANAVIMYLNMKRGGEMGTAPMQAGIMRTVAVVLPAASFLFMFFQPGAVQLYFFVSVLLNLGQVRLMTNGYFRNTFGLYPLAPVDPKPDGSGSHSKSPTNSPLGPAGLKLYQPQDPTPIVPQAKDISVIDKFVDNAKARQKDFVDGIYTTMGTTKEARVKERQQEALRQKAHAYEQRVAREEEMKRESRNSKRTTPANVDERRKVDGVGRKREGSRRSRAKRG